MVGTRPRVPGIVPRTLLSSGISRTVFIMVLFPFGHRGLPPGQCTHQAEQDLVHRRRHAETGALPWRPCRLSSVSVSFAKQPPQPQVASCCLAGCICSSRRRAWNSSALIWKVCSGAGKPRAATSSMKDWNACPMTACRSAYFLANQGVNRSEDPTDGCGIRAILPPG